jgi:hypothetical protein
MPRSLVRIFLAFTSLFAALLYCMPACQAEGVAAKVVKEAVEKGVRSRAAERTKKIIKGLGEDMLDVGKQCVVAKLKKERIPSICQGTSE